MVIEHSGQQIICCTDSVEVACEMEVDILHGDNLRISATGGTTLDAEYRTQRRLSQCYHGILADTTHTVSKADGRGGLTLAGSGGGDSSNQDQFSVPAALFEGGEIDLGFVVTVLLKILFGNACSLGNLGDMLHLDRLCNFNIGHHSG